MWKKLEILLVIALLALGLIVRLYKIDAPLADWHSWRQADTSAVTRNWVKHGVDILTPRYDDFSDVSGNGLFNPDGYRFAEFPLFNLVHYSFYSLLSSFFSLELVGRLTSILATLISSVLLFLLIRRHTTPTVALLAASIFLFLPYNIYFTRVVLPDPLMVTLVLAALWTQPSSRPLTWIFGSLAVLVKPTAIFFLLPLLKDFWLFVSLLLPFGIWRIWEHRFPAGIPASLWLLNGNHIRFRPAWFRWLFGERLGDMILGQWGIFPFLLGLFQANSYFLSWAAGALLYLIVFATGNIQHDYYQIPLIPIVSVLVALGVVHFSTTLAKKAVMVFCLLLMFGLAWYDIKGDYQVNNWSIVRAGQAVDKLLPKDAIVVAPYNGDTAFLYQTNRRGFPNLSLPIKDLRDRYGAEYYVSVNYDDQTNAIVKKYTILEQTPEYVIVQLVEPIRP
ncbi:MAG: hypothetical protein UY11_C0026G0009 [Candidatus Amesbacteria bacterium GW2011_GWC2_47_8]|uniref:Glycosyltransferase RgtA/B/C/D-like domain-containing protein n=1 Tax=Candidatus Amesbacteria bacterium GW2011_GWC2_47_8 TaxID=1618367 RepID=A0A0G1TMZ3_9BACT|nr:MAG: hypothetical protein UY11_C0026G0009 [Candidatus Amesbacteria bacterium GW2011_GWC2_47_8]